MATPDPNKLPRRRASFRRLGDQLKVSLHNPYLGVTQGGSSSEHAGARVAATHGLKPLRKPEKTKEKSYA